MKEVSRVSKESFNTLGYATSVDRREREHNMTTLKLLDAKEASLKYEVQQAEERMKHSMGELDVTLDEKLDKTNHTT